MSRSSLLALLVAGACACAGGRRSSPIGTARADDASWDYRVVAEDGAATLSVEATFAAGTAPQMSVTEGAEPFVRELRVRAKEGWTAVPATGDRWELPSCRDGCAVRYRFSLRDAARAIGRDEIATELGAGAYGAPPQTWLVHPLEARAGERFRLHVATSGGTRFASGLPRRGEARYGLARELGLAPYAVFGALRVTRVPLKRGSLTLAIAPGPLAVGDDAVTRWIARNAEAVSDYYDALPIDGALYTVVPTRADGVGFGRTTAGAGGGAITIDIGGGASEAALAGDWVAAHESVHLAFPSLPREGIWLEEGLATYLEPIARARAGLASERDVWHQFASMMPLGLPQPGDRGLDLTHTWGRVYWGGAIFFLVADVEIRKRTSGARSLQDALRGVLRAGGNDAARWSLERTLAEGDRATGTSVLRELHASMGAKPGAPDLPALFAALGVRSERDGVVLRDDAELAALRRSIAEPAAALERTN